MDCIAPSETLSQIEAWRCWWDAVDISQSHLFSGIWLLERTVHGWGRIGKGLQAAAAVVVVMDIIGADAIQRWGRRLTMALTLQRAARWAMPGLQVFVDVIVRQLGGWWFRLPHIWANVTRVAHAIRIYFKGNPLDLHRLGRARTCVYRAAKVALFSRKGRRAKKMWREKRLPWAVQAESVENRYIFPVAASAAALFAAFIVYIEYDKNFARGISNAAFGAVFSFYAVMLAYGFLSMMVRVLVAVAILFLAGLAAMIDAVVIEPVAWVIGHDQNENLVKGISLGVFLVGFYFDLLAS